MNMSRRAFLTGFGASALVLASAGTAFAQSRDRRTRKGLVPMRDVVRKIRRRSDGRMLDAAYNEELDRYRIIWQREDGEIEYYYVDARSGKILSVKKRRDRKRRRPR